MAFLVISILLLPGSFVAFASVPAKFSYEGRLVDASGNPITASKSITFKIYDAATGGNVVWSGETLFVLPIS